MHVPGPHEKSGERVENVTVTKMSWLQSCAYQCRFQGSAKFYVREESVTVTEKSCLQALMHIPGPIKKLGELEESVTVTEFFCRAELV